MSYVPRVVDAQLRSALESSGAVIIEGPKACGKTETARRVANSEVLLDTDERARLAAQTDPSLILAGSVPRLIDEWQIAPNVWNHVRRAVDRAQVPGQFILTGSANPPDDIMRHTGAGRFSRIQMRPMSLFEMDSSTGAISLSAILANEPVRSSLTTCSISTIAELVATGGWPAMRTLTVDARLSKMRSYLDDIRRVDIGAVEQTRRDPLRVGTLLRSLGRHVATCATISTLARDVGGDEEPIDRETVREYLAALQRLMIVEDQPAWAVHLRSKSRLRGSAKRHFVDPCLAVAALGTTPQRLLMDLNLLGLLYESMVIRDLRIYSQALGGTVFHYGDNTGLEVDAIVESSDGTWGAFEIKLGPGRIEEGAASLKKFVDRIDTSRCGLPAVMAVIVPDGYGYVRADGIAVVPLGALGP